MERDQGSNPGSTSDWLWGPRPVIGPFLSEGQPQFGGECPTVVAVCRAVGAWVQAAEMFSEMTHIRASGMVAGAYK